MGSVSLTHDKVVLDAKGSVRSLCGKGAAIIEYSDDIVKRQRIVRRGEKRTSWSCSPALARLRGVCISAVCLALAGGIP